LWKSKNNSVKNCTCYYNGDYGISIGGDCYNNSIINNTCVGSDMWGIRLSDNANYNHISGNRVETNSYAISISESYNNIVKENYCTGGSSGVSLYKSNYNSIENNTIERHNYAGIRLDGSDSNRITGNHIRDCSFYGIRLVSTEYNSIAYNTITGNRIGISTEYYVREYDIHHNSFYGNVEFGLYADEGTAAVVNAALNWWGHDSGPYHPSENPTGEGDNVSDKVEFVPWLTEGKPPEPGELSGTVRDIHGSPLQKVHIRITCGGGLYREGFTNENGFYEIRDIPLVECYWNITVSKDGYKDSKVSRAIDEDSVQDFTLYPVDIFYVDDDAPHGGNGTMQHPFNKIQSAIDAASAAHAGADDAGAVICVWEGVYYENVVVDRTVSLIGNGSHVTIIDAGGNGHGIRIYADNVEIRGFTIRNSGPNHAGILAKKSNIFLADNVIEECGDGIVFSGMAPALKDWNRTFGGSNIEYGYELIPTSDGNFVMVGNTNSYGAGSRDFWLVKFDVHGSEIWNRTFGGDSNDYGRSVVETADGGFLLGGYTHSFGKYADIWVIKTDSEGNPRWDRTFGGEGLDDGFDKTYSVLETADGNFLIGGISSSQGTGGYDAWLIKLDKSGKTMWDGIYGYGNATDHLYQVLETGDGGFVIAGDTKWQAGNYYSAWAIRTDPNGTEIWNRTFDRGTYTRFHAVEETPDGFIFTGSTMAHSAGKEDVWLVKLNHNGTECWNRSYGGQDSDYAEAITKLADGGFVIAAVTQSFGDSSGDTWLLKVDETGVLEWDARYGGDRTEYISSVLETPDGSLMISGTTMSEPPHDWDAWVIKTRGKAESIVPSSNNTIRDCTVTGGSGSGIRLENTVDSWISDCAISNNRIGISLLGSSRYNTVQYSNIYSNTEYGISASGNDACAINARYNWWGDDSGPYHPVNNTGGKGDNVTDYVDFNPWIGKEEEPGERTTWYVDDDAPPGGNGSKERPFNKIQHAIDSASAGATIYVWEGIYYEKVVVDKSVNLIGNGSKYCIINSTGNPYAIGIEADQVNLSGFGVVGIQNKEDWGIWVGSDNNRIFENDISGNYHGIYIRHQNLWVPSCRNLISDNTFSGNLIGIILDYSEHNMISNNTFLNTGGGIHLADCRYDTLIGNNMTTGGICLWGDSVEHWNTHSIDASNIVNGKSVAYYKNRTGISVPSGAGQVILANCSSMLLEDMVFSDCWAGILVGHSSDITITNITGSNNLATIFLSHSDHCTITNNSCTNDWEDGITLRDSDYNFVYRNNCSNGIGGIDLKDSDYNTLMKNTCFRNNYSGISLRRSRHNIISYNDCSSNGRGFDLCLSSFNTFTNNTCSANEGQGMRLDRSRNNTFNHNNFSSNKNYAIFLEGSDSNTFLHNTIYENGMGIYLEDSSSDNAAHYNSIFNNVDFGIDASNNSGYTINVTLNYWGDDSGPYHPTKNPTGKGDNVTDFVDFDPWLETDEGDDGDSADDTGETDWGYMTSYILLGLGLFLIGNLAILFYAAHCPEALIEPFWLKRHSARYASWLRYRLLHLFLPLYTRINEKKIEKDIRQQNIRGRIYQHIKEKPGVNFSEIRKEMNISNGTTIYHLTVLQREGFIRSAMGGNRKQFWVKSEFPGSESAALTELQRNIVALLDKNGKMSRSDILEKLGVSRSTLDENLKRLAENGTINVEKEGKSNFCSLK